MHIYIIVYIYIYLYPIIESKIWHKTPLWLFHSYDKKALEEDRALDGLSPAHVAASIF